MVGFVEEHRFERSWIVTSKRFINEPDFIRALQHLRANNLVMWEAIRWGRDHGYRSLCLGRTEPGNDGLRHFKMGWGAQERVIWYYRYDLGNNTFIKSPRIVRPAHKRIFGKLPIPILNLLGRILYRHMG